ncbi:ABC transporter substrate-binding protein [Isoptericola hypogeus]|uniref:ABC transporter substrate-binding protein n=1 Tax=Isoptericola hypogeus TaxID=300179 RepID=A0ABP4V6Q7_9MICO
MTAPRTRHAIVAATATALTLSACGADGSGDGGQEVTLWMYPVIADQAASKEFWDTAEADFEKANPDVDLAIELQTFDKRDAQISAALAAGSGPDLVLITPDQAATYHAIGGLLPVDDAVADIRDAFYPAALDSATIEDELFGVPIFQNVFTTAYNTAIFEDAGLALPRTWDDLRAAAPELAKEGIAVMDYAGSPEQTLNLSFYPFLWQAGGHVFTDDGADVAFDSPEGAEALQLLVDLQQEGALPPDAATDGPAVEGAPIARGEAAMRATTSLTEYGQLQAAVGDDSAALGQPLTGAEQVTYGNAGLLSLTSINDESNRQAAYDVLAFMSTPDFQESLNAAAGNLPTRTDVAVDDSDPAVASMAEALELAYPGEPSPASRQVMAALAPKIQAALRGDMSAEEALAAAAEESRQILANTQP